VTATERTPLGAALQHVAAMLETLSTEQLEDIAAGRGELVFRSAAAAPAARPRRTGARRPIGAEASAAAEEINELVTPSEVADYLHRHDARFTLPVLREIARALGPTVATTGRTKADLRRDIVAGTAGFRVRAEAMSGGAWS
jgi:hypothetical protein